MQIGNDAYPPIPKISVGLLKTKKKRDLKDEKKIKINEKNFSKIFLLLKGNDGKIIISIFFFLLKIYNLYYL